MGTLRTLIGVGVITGVVVYVFLRSLNGKVDQNLLESTNENAQLV